MPEPKGSQEESMMKVAFLVNGKPDLRPVPRHQSLKSLIQELVEHHNRPGTGEDYCLIYQLGDRVREYRIVTEKNRGEMHAAHKNIIEMAESPARSSARILKEIETDGKELTSALEDLSRMSVDPTFALEFFTRKGLAILMYRVSGDKFKLQDLSLVLSSINSLLDQEIISLEEATADREFISKVAMFTNTLATDSSILTYALLILTTLVRECHGNESGEFIERQLALSNLVSLMGRSKPQVQLNSLTLINTLLQHANPHRKSDMIRMLSEKPTRTIILEHLLDTKDIPSEMRNAFGQQLYLVQYHILNQIQDRMMTRIEPQDSLALQKIKDLRSTAFDTDSPNVKNNTRFAQDYRKLGFTNEKDPTLDFMATPPGILALDCMDYFAKSHTDQFTKVVLENSCRSDNHECPFAASSIELVRLLADILGIGKPCVQGSNKFYEMFFKTEYPFEEFYTHCIVLLNKTWREMRATREDFRKVFDVVREQIEKALNTDRPKTFDQFRSQVKSYSDISRKWQKDAKSREAWESSEPVKVLRQHLVEEVEDLIRQQRFNFMVEGTKFPRYKRSGDLLKGQYRYVKLHTNHKTLYAGDWNHEKTVPGIEDLEPVLQVSEITDVFQGQNCPFLKDYASKGKETCTKLAFSVVGETSSLDCVAPDEQTFNYWLDGINVLLRRPMVSPDHGKEREILLDMEVKLRLLDLEGVDLPTSAPEVPPPPPPFRFSQTN